MNLRRKLIGEIYSCIAKAAGFPQPTRPPVGSPAAPASLTPAGGGLPFKAENQCAPDRHDTAVRRTKLRVFQVHEGHVAVKIRNGRT